MNLNDDIITIKGVGEKSAPLYRKLGMNNVDDVIHYFPRDYVYYEKISDSLEGSLLKNSAISVVLVKKPLLKTAGRYKIVTASFVAFENLITVTWFNMPFLTKSLKEGNTYVIKGILEEKADHYHMEQPVIFTNEQYESIKESYMPVYSVTKGLSNNTVTKCVKNCLSDCHLEDDDIYQIHFPKDSDALHRARSKFVYEEFLLFILRLRLLKGINERAQNDFTVIPVAQCARVIEKLPYKLTNAQMRVWHEVEDDLCKNHSMSRLIQGDVGSGKTIISFLAAVMMGINGYQTAVMAPTEILANQHFESFCDLIKKNVLNLKVVLLTGSMNASSKSKVYKMIEEKEADIIIGTHALIQDKVKYNRLGLVITDEQHRFGVNQREYLLKKNDTCYPHVLVMSATPIPRTLAIILYGDLDISVIDETPAKRLPIKNCVVNINHRQNAYSLIRKEINSSHQAYVICPLVEKSDEMDACDVITYTQKLKTIFPESVNIECLHGKMSAKAKNDVMSAFSRGDLDILVSTTVVEVGVNVPNATVMLVENADRFGLAQLHQLRGRIGRGDAQSYCIFMSGSTNEKTLKRLDILNHSNDGFLIASEDLKQRGPGDLFGIRQSGDLRFKMADIYTDAEILKKAAEDAKRIMDEDPKLEKEENKSIRDKLYSKDDNLEVLISL